MPKSVRLFWWISVVIALYWVIMAAWVLFFPGAEYLSFLARSPQWARDAARNYNAREMEVALIWAAPTLTLAWLAAFKRLCWARWGFVGLFIVNQTGDLLLLLLAAAGSQKIPLSTFLNIYFESLAVRDWVNPWMYFVPAMGITAIALVFSKPAQPWFAKDPNPRVIVGAPSE